MKRLAIMCAAALLLGAGQVLAGQAPPGGQPARGPAPPPTPACGPNLAMKNVAKDSRCFELRTYTVREGSSIDLLHSRFRDHTMKIFEKHGMTNVGYWVPQDSPAHESTLIYVISHSSREAAKANWAAFMADPEWKKVSDASQVDGKIVERVESVFVDATDYSPIK